MPLVERFRRAGSWRRGIGATTVQRNGRPARVGLGRRCWPRV